MLVAEKFGDKYEYEIISYLPPTVLYQVEPSQVFDRLNTITVRSKILALNSPDASPEEMPHSNVVDMWCWAQSHTRPRPQPAVRRAGGFAGKARLD